MMHDDINWDLLDRFFADECTPEERAEVVRWLESHPVPAKYVDALRRALDIGEAAPASWNADAAWTRVAERTGLEPRATPEAPLRRVPAGRERRWSLPGASRFSRIAAVLALLVASGAAWWALRPRERAAPAAVAMREFATVRAQRAELRLPDGTRVMLGTESKLRVPADYGAAARSLFLEGQAYFDVAHDDTKPFAVHARNAIAIDLGTRFGVRAYASDRVVQVVVAEGKVALSSPPGPLSTYVERRNVGGTVLARGDLGRVDSVGAVAVTRGLNVDRYLGWTEGELAFERTRLRDALPDLMRWYDLDIELAARALGDRRLTLTLRDESLTQALNAVALLVHARYERDGRRVTFYPDTLATLPGAVR